MDRDTPPANWDEAAYLEGNPDVARVVSEGGMPSGWSHFLGHGYREFRKGVAEDVLVLVHEHVGYRYQDVVAPIYLRNRLDEISDAAGFAAKGRVIAQNLFGEFMRMPIPDHCHILELGVGSGWVMQPLHDLCVNTRLTSRSMHWFGTDFDEVAIQWDKNFLYEIGQFSVATPLPPLEFPEKSFDFIYSVTVFNRLSEDLQFHWLDELRRLVKPTGLVFIATCGVGMDESVEAAPSEAEFRCYDEEKAEETPEFYRRAFHGHEYIAKNWGKYFDVARIAPRGVANEKDLIVLRPRSERRGIWPTRRTRR